MECLAFLVIHILIIPLKICATKAYYLSSAMYCCMCYCCPAGLYVHCTATNQCKDANSTETQKSSPINKAQVCVLLSSQVLQGNNFKQNYLCKGKNPLFSGLVNVTPKRKSIWKGRETKSMQLRTCIFRDTI